MPRPNATLPDRLPARDRTTITVLIVSAFVVILNETIMNVALPRLMEQFHVSASAIQWLATAFMLTMSVVIPATGYLLTRFPIRSAFILAMGLFSTGTLLAGLAPGFEVLVVARVIQASGTAIMMPLLMTTILDLVPSNRRGAIMGNVSIVIAVAPAIGPTLSGFILHSLSWRFMFLAVLPIALLALVLGARLLPSDGKRSTSRLSVPSLLISIPAFGGLVYGLSGIGSPDAKTHDIALLALGVSLVALVTFVLLQLRLQRHDGALLDLRPFLHRQFTLALALMVMAMVAMFGVIILLPMYLQNVRGLDVLSTGLLMLPGGLLMGLLAPWVGKLFDKFGARPLLIPGGLVLSAVLFGYTQLNATTPLVAVVGLHILMSIGLAFIFTPGFTAGLNPLPHSLHSHGSAVLATLQQLGGAAGTALLVGVMTAGTLAAATAGKDPLAAQASGFSASFLVAAFVSLGIVVIAMFMGKAAAAQDTDHAPAEALEMH
ncbi:DHA2 family lincomycin resistance protein-like MFS transporter [Arthrobacter silviterrae]|uniref:Multidrug efflux MFS transporter n=1 Tax=Arthrobacter silviterrae TaxID=2026658 RepID=A0ABX0DFC2_9MICC|nr:MDR family MFS transporter [Arthrobacter silviterrae]MDQ0279087.1 DHA2 family lincomycin resistance protein-like MFS transporter [Arthrobacter silviterrae]NGN83210.1 multidrug efflux MFS transporter [Arthrobacter silviterrae]